MRWPNLHTLIITQDSLRSDAIFWDLTRSTDLKWPNLTLTFDIHIWGTWYFSFYCLNFIFTSYTDILQLSFFFFKFYILHWDFVFYNFAFHHFTFYTDNLHFTPTFYTYIFHFTLILYFTFVIYILHFILYILHFTFHVEYFIFYI